MRSVLNCAMSVCVRYRPDKESAYLVTVAVDQYQYILLLTGLDDERYFLKAGPLHVCCHRLVFCDMLFSACVGTGISLADELGQILGIDGSHFDVV